MNQLPADIHERVLLDLQDGVMVVERTGAVAVFNAAAEHILGLDASQVLGNSFGELFILREGCEEFAELVLGAVADGSRTGSREVVKLQAGDEVRSLSVATSYLRTKADGEAAQSALVVVFSDITELRQMRETELRMAQAMEAKHDELQQAYRRIEERNDTLAILLKKVQVARVLSTAAVMAVLLGLGFYTWQPLDLFGGPGLGLFSRADAEVVAEPNTLVVETRPVRETMSLVGQLAPWRTVTLMSPIESRIVATHVRPGQEVKEGDLLLELDTGEAVRKHRQAQLAHIEALAAFEAVSDWEKGVEMANANRSFTQARMALQGQESRLKRAAFLLEQGLIAESEHEDAERRYRSQLLDFEAARVAFEAAKARGGEEARNKAALQLSTAREEMEELENSANVGLVRSPVTGMVLAPVRARSDFLAEGTAVDRGKVLLAVGDFSRMAALTVVDEIDVLRIRVGQRVSVTGNAFRDLSLQGAVTRVSSQPLPKTRGVVQFEVEVTLDALEPAERKRLRTGMSCRLEIVVYGKEAALLIPIRAVEKAGRGTSDSRGRPGDARGQRARSRNRPDHPGLGGDCRRAGSRRRDRAAGELSVRFRMPRPVDIETSFLDSAVFRR